MKWAGTRNIFFFLLGLIGTCGVYSVDSYILWFLTTSGNVLKEISEPAGAIIRVKDFILGDPTISILELWGAEYQESNALLVRSEDRNILQEICDREKVPVSFVGTITGKRKSTRIDCTL